MATGTTKFANLINPEVMADMISAKIPKKNCCCTICGD